MFRSTSAEVSNVKILIISAFFPPQNSIASLRPYSWAKYWSRAGHDVTVLTIPKDHHPSDTCMPTKGFNIVEVPIPALTFLNRLSGGEGARRESKDNLSQALSWKSNLRKWYKTKLDSWKRHYGILYSCRMPDRMDTWKAAALRAVKNQRWDLIVSSGGPYCVHAPAYYLRTHGLAKKWVIDWRDLWVDNHIFPGLPGVRLIERWLEKTWSERADMITTVSQPLADILRQKYGSKVYVIFNGFDLEDYKQIPREHAFPDDRIVRIVYTGTVYRPFQNPTPLFRALAQMERYGKIQPRCLQVLFCGHNANVDDLARKEGVEVYVKYLGFVPRARSLHMQRDASALLFLEFESESAEGVLTGKLFEYLFAGPPVLAIGVGKESGAGELLERTGSGQACGRDIGKIVAFVEDLLNKQCKPRKDLPGEVMSFSRQAAADKLLNFVTGEGL